MIDAFGVVIICHTFGVELNSINSVCLCSQPKVQREKIQNYIISKHDAATKLELFAAMF